jgi:hypothetical protein
VIISVVDDRAANLRDLVGLGLGLGVEGKLLMTSQKERQRACAQKGGRQGLGVSQ